MRFSTSVLAVFLSAIAVSATSPHDSAGLSARHNRLAQRASNLEAKAVGKRCAKRVNKNAPPTTNNLASTTKNTTTPAPPPPAKPVQDAPKAPVKNTNNAGLINVQSNCGDIRATSQSTKLSGPNGHIDWMNCGFETDGGWQPPYVRIENIITQSLSAALQSPSSPFKACSAFVWIFEKYGNQYGIPPIILASFAMQESSCKPDTVGGGGEQGLMQITQEKCGGAPGGNCRDIDFNIRTGAKFFADTLARNNGDLFLSVGQYNGWHRGLTKWKAFAAASSSCCRCQNNGDYLHQFFNGWCQNINSYDSGNRLGKYYNLDVCN
ncbi:glycoside hydrolase family 23 protein [Crassisporium funariophilum]|nr:glycoside hydrolase family 23 protein [Crassisporium funariophilum]